MSRPVRLLGIAAVAVVLLIALGLLGFGPFADLPEGDLTPLPTAGAARSAPPAAKPAPTPKAAAPATQAPAPVRPPEGLYRPVPRPRPAPGPDGFPPVPDSGPPVPDSTPLALDEAAPGP